MKKLTFSIVFILTLIFLLYAPMILAEKVGPKMETLGSPFGIRKDTYSSLNYDLNKIYTDYGALVDIYAARSIDASDKNDFAKKKFLEYGLDKQGIPTLNVLIVYSEEDKLIKLVYSDNCGYDPNAINFIAKEMERIMNSGSAGTFREDLAVSAVSSSLVYLKKEMKEKVAQGAQCTFIPKVSDENCKTIYNDKWDGKKRRILFLGSGFGSEEEFKSTIINFAIDGAFKKIQPFKDYTRNGDNGVFQFLYGGYNLKVNYVNGGYDTNTGYNILNEENKCPNVYLTIVLDKNWDKSGASQFGRGFYSSDDKIFVSLGRSEELMHEVGHNFKLDDEYQSPSAKILYGTLCSPSADVWKKFYGNIKSDFKGCANQEDYYRSSPKSIMTSNGDYFNLLSCLYIVKTLEGKSLDDPQVYNICKKMYDNKELEQNEASEQQLKDCLKPVRIDKDSGADTLKLDADQVFCEDGYSLYKEGFTLDCQGHKIKTLKGSNGIVVENKVTVKNCIVEGFDLGMFISTPKGGENVVINTDLLRNTQALFISTYNANTVELVGSQAQYNGMISIKRNFAGWPKVNDKITYTKNE